MAPSAVVLNIRISPDRMMELQRARVPMELRTESADRSLRLEQEKEARALGLDPFRYARTDATGVRRPDSGVLVYSWGKDQEEKRPHSLRKVWDDIEALGLTPFGASIMKKERDHMYFLRFTFAESGPDISCGDVAAAIMMKLLSRTFYYGYVYRNPNGSMTINPSRISERNVGVELRDLRIPSDSAPYGEAHEDY